MKCEICQINEATVHFKQVTDGEQQELYVCESCAAENGFDPQSPMGLTDFLFGVGVQADPVMPTTEKSCPACRMTGSEMQKKTRLGCPECYNTFSEELNVVLDNMHNGAKHIGKVPSAYQTTLQLQSLEKALETAIGAEDFEEAAILRDKIREMSS